MAGLVIVGTLATADFAGVLRRFASDFPAARLALRTATSREVSALVRRGEATLGLRYGEDDDPILNMIPVGREVLLAVAARDLAVRLETDTALLHNQPWVGFAPVRDGGSFGGALARLRAAAGLEDAPFMPVDSLTAQLRLVEAGLGLGLLPAATAEEALSRGSLARVPATVPLETSVPVVLVRRRDAYLSAAARALAELLCAPRDPLA